MTAYKKIAVTVPAPTYQALERARAKLGTSRSEAVALAIQDWLRGLEASEARRRYAEGYLRLPETADRDAALAITKVAVADWPAWEPGPSSRAAERKRRR
jgi:metal-responsive CopG/Arc/MetJ family transcriptional regulator